MCDHKWVLMNTRKSCKGASEYGYQIKYIKVMQFFCEKCLETKEKRLETFSKETPDWY
jgi:hypothetical protein